MKTWFRSTFTPVIRHFHLHEVPSTVWVLSAVSMLMNISSVMISSLSPLFLMNVLMASATTVGIIRGLTEGVGYFARVFAGALSDYVGKRKMLVVLGYGFAVLTKPIFATTSSILWYGMAQFFERCSNGLRDTPRDAMILDVAPPQMKGICFGLRQGFATAGAFVGAIIATVAMVYTARNYQIVYWISTIPVVLAVLLLVKGVKEPQDVPARKGYTSQLISWSEIRDLGRSYWMLILVIAVFMLARFSEAFLLMRARSLNMDESYAPMVLMVMNLAYMLSGNSVATVMDRFDRRLFLWIGFPTLILSYILMGFFQNLGIILCGVFVYGLHMGTTQSVLAAMVADLTPRHLRATSFGIFSLTCGIMLTISISFAGVICDALGIASTFLAGAVIAGVATLLLLFIRPSNTPRKVQSAGAA
jgi:MFS family permease